MVDYPRRFAAVFFGLAALNSATDTSTGFTFRSPALTFGAIAAIFTGMLAALTPCLLLHRHSDDRMVGNHVALTDAERLIPLLVEA